MLHRWANSLMKKVSRPSPPPSQSPSISPSPPPGPARPDNSDAVADELYEIACELNVVIDAFDKVAFVDDEAFGLSLIIRRQVWRLQRLVLGAGARG